MKALHALLIAIGAGLLASQAHANPYASQLSSSTADFDPVETQTVELGFYLNEDADSVIVEVFGPLPDTDTLRTFDLGALAPGAHSVEWDGKDDAEDLVPMGEDYSFRVLTESAGYGDWTNITPTDGGDQIASTYYPHPTSLAVIRNMDSPHFGVVAVANSVPGDNGFDAEQGLYLLNSDLSWYGGSATASFNAAMNDPAAPWDPDASNSPYKVKAGKDDGMLYTSDWGINVVYRSDLQDTGVQVLAEGGEHDSLLTAMTTGTGAETVLWGIQEGARTDIVRWNIGDDVPHTGDPELFANVPGASQLRDIGFDGDGNVYVSLQPSTDGQAALAKFDPDGNELWTQTRGDLMAQGYPTDPGEPLWFLGMTHHDGLLYVIDARAIIVALFDAETGAFVADFFNVPDLAGFTGRSLDVDAAGNVYITDNNGGVVSVWSPWGPSDFTTMYYGTITAGEGPVAVPEWRAYD